MSSEVVVANLALTHAGVGKQIASLTEASEPARAINQLWHPTMKDLQRETRWKFNKRIMELTLINPDPTIAYSAQWSRAYRWPPEMLRIDAVLPSRDSQGTIADLQLVGRVLEIPYDVMSDSSGRMILTNEEGAEAKYGHYEEQVDLWPTDFQMCASLRLAAYIAVRMGKGDKQKIGQRSFELYQMSLEKARVTNAQEGVPIPDDDGDMIRSRG